MDRHGGDPLRRRRAEQLRRLVEPTAFNIEEAQARCGFRRGGIEIERRAERLLGGFLVAEFDAKTGDAEPDLRLMGRQAQRGGRRPNASALRPAAQSTLPSSAKIVGSVGAKAAACANTLAASPRRASSHKANPR
jgi:hypothetical protein